MAKDSGIGGVLKLLVLSFVVALVLAYLKIVSPVVAIGIAGLAMVGLPFTNWGKTNLKIRLDWQKAVTIIVGIALVGGAFLNYGNPVFDVFGQGIQQGTASIGGSTSGGTTPATTTTGGTVSGGEGTTSGQRLTTTTATLSILAKNLLNKSDDNLNPTGQYLYGGGYQTLSFSSGKATITSLDPYATIEKVSVGTDGTFYWSQKDDIALNGQLSPTTKFDLVRVYTSLDLRASSQGGGGVSTYADITNGTANLSVGSAGSAKFYVRPEVLSLYTGARRPVLGHSVNTSQVEDVYMAGLNEVTCPSGLVTADQASRVLYKCFDTGFDWIVDSGSKKVDGNILYGFKDFPAEVKFKTGINPTANDATSCTGTTGTTNFGTRTYIFDQDEYYRNPSGQLFFQDPPTRSTNLGATDNPSILTCYS